MSRLLKDRAILLLIGVFFVGLILKLINFWDIQIFAYDQARDAQRIFEILHGNIKLVGPETDIRGIFNGPFYYYLLAPLYLISGFNPNIVNLFMVLVNLSGIFLVYYISLILFKNKYVGLISALLWAVSFEQANFARFISNASFMPISTLVFFLGLALYFVRGNKWGLPISILGLGFAIHFNIYLAYLIVLYPLFIFIFKKRPSVKHLLGNALLFLLILSPFIVAEIKFNFMALQSLIAYFGKHASESGSLIENLNSYPARISGALYYGFFSFNKSVSLLLLSASVIYLIKAIKDRRLLIFLMIWTFSTFPLFFFKSGVITAEVINTSIFGALTIVFGLTIHNLLNTRYKYLGVILLAAIIISNLTLFVREGFASYKLFSLQTLVLKEEEELIDYTYNSSNGEEFSICAVSNPLFVNTLWSYLYNFYGKERFGSVPYWSGQKQNLNASLIPYDTGKVKNRYLIIEPLGGIPLFASQAMIYMEDQISVIKETRNFGTLTVQKRELSLNKGEVRDSQRLSPGEVEELKRLISIDQRYSCYNNY